MSEVPDRVTGPMDRRETPPDRVEISMEQWQFQSPLPPPAVLREYEQIIPGFAERYMAGWESQTAHRQRLESTVVATQAETQRRAQPLAFALGLAVVVVAGLAVLTDHEAAAIAIVSIDFVGLGGVFVFGKSRNDRELRRKAEAVPDPSPPSARANRTLPKNQPTNPQPNQKRRKSKRSRR